MIVLKVALYPMLLVIMHIIDYPMWRLYKKEGYNVENYFKWFWRHHYSKEIPSYTKT